mmetsp:Transcript_44420/g.128554  ORF Transcript_44420/g.128554 Transcript_44420/m.128554 type:complete len:227 (+) Transcript_44420:971-1651(+)
MLEQQRGQDGHLLRDVLAAVQLRGQVGAAQALHHLCRFLQRLREHPLRAAAAECRHQVLPALVQEAMRSVLRLRRQDDVLRREEGCGGPRHRRGEDARRLLLPLPRGAQRAGGGAQRGPLRVLDWRAQAPRLLPGEDAPMRQPARDPHVGAHGHAVRGRRALARANSPGLRQGPHPEGRRGLPRQAAGHDAHGPAARGEGEPAGGGPAGAEPGARAGPHAGREFLR